MRVVKPKKFLGQHFLKDLKVAQDIADTVDACPNLPILEVGPGMGVLTQFLLPKERTVKVVEVDYESVAYLREAYPQLEDNIIEDDFLKMNLQRLFDGQPFVLTGNYPYNISSQIFFKMLDNKELIPCCTGMIQKEVAERMSAKPSTKDYGAITVLCQYYTEPSIVANVPASLFVPPPKVDSAVLKLKVLDKPSVEVKDEGVFFRVVKAAFSQRRKTLLNCLSANFPIPKDEISTLLESIGIAPSRRGETLSLKEFANIADTLLQKIK